MRARVIAFAPVVVLALACAVARAAHAADDVIQGGVPAARPFADRVVAAVVKGDDAAARAAVESEGGDPVAVAVRLLALRAAGAAASPPREGRELEAAAALGRLYADTPRGRGLDALVSTWKAWDKEALLREARLWAFETKKGGLAEVAAEMAARKDDLAAAGASPGALMLRERHAVALAGAGRAAESADLRLACVAAADALPWPMRACVLRHLVSVPLLSLERAQAALDLAERGVLDATACDMPLALARLARVKAAALKNLGRSEAALVAAEEAREIAKRTGSEPLVLAAESVRAEILSLVGRSAEAVEIGSRIFEAHRARGDVASAARDLIGLSAYESRAGHRAAAITLLERAEVLTAEMKDPADARRLRATIDSSLGDFLVKGGDFERGLVRLRRALSEREALGLFEAAARTKAFIGVALTTAGRLEEGLAIHREVLAVAQRSASPSTAARAAVAVACDLALLGRGREARETAEAALRRAEGATLEAEVEPLLRYWIAAALHLEKDEVGSDRAFAALIVPGAEERIAPGQLRDMLAVHAEVLLALGRSREASAEARRALEAHRRLWDGLGEDEAVASRGRHARTLVDLALRIALARGGPEASEAERAGATEDAFATIELGRALLLAEGLVNRAAILSARLSPALAQEDVVSRRRLDTARAAVRALLPSAPDAEHAARRAALEKAEAERAEVAARVHREIRFGGEILSPTPATLADARAALAKFGADAAYVAYERAGDRLLAVVVTPLASALVDLGPAKGLDTRGAAWVDRLAAGANDEILAARLFDALLAKTLAVVGPVRRLLIAPDAARAGLPFAALLAKGRDGKPERAIERYEIALVPSATAWLALSADAARSPRGDGVLAIGDPSLGDAEASFAQLPNADEEARGVASLYPAARRTVLTGADATLARVRAALATGDRRLRAVQFSGHALMDPDHPRRSAIVLAGGDRWGLDDVAEIGVPADVTVLSACDTAVATDLGGEGPVGFPRRLFLAGCPRVVVTAWPIGDASAGPVVRRLHEAMERDGLPVAEALRAAQRERLAAGDPPRAWAAFLLWGLAE